MSNSKKMITQIGKIVGQSINAYYPNKLKSKVDEVKFKEAYQGRIIDCMVGEVDDNYIETPETDEPIVKLEYSKEGVVKIPSIKGKTILVDADGNETDTPAEGCRLISVGENEDNKLIILSNNKNLLDVSTFKNIDIGIRDIIGFDIRIPIGHQSNGRVLTTVKVKPNTQYTFSVDNTSNTFQVFIGFADDNFIGVKNEIVWAELPNNNKYITFTTTSNTHYLYINAHSNYDLQLEEGELSSYVSQKTHKTEILLDEPLRKLPNGVCDEVIDNKIIRKIGEVILDGNEDWKLANTYTSTYKFAHWVSTLPKAISRGNNKDQLSNKLTISNPYMETKNSVWIYGTQLRLFLDGSQTTVEEFKQWLNENPITLIYELAEPIIEELPNGITLQGFDDTTMYIENSITPTVQYGYNALIPYKEELSKQKEEVETNTSDIENNIIPYLMDMEFNIMLMEGDINGTEG